MKRWFTLKCMFLILGFVSWGLNGFGQTTIFSENMGTPTGTTIVATYAAGTAPATFQNKGTLTYGIGGATTTDVRITSISSGYTIAGGAASGGGNVYFTSTAGSYGFSIESINASTYNTLVLQFGYRKESATALATFAVDYWNGTAWVNFANAADIFNEAASAGAGWYLSKALSLPAAAQISGLKIRFVKSGATAIRIDDVLLTGTSTTTTTPTITATPTSLAGFTTTTGTASAPQSVSIGGTNLTSDITITPTGNYEISTNGTTWISTPSTIVLAQTGGTVASTTVQTRIMASAPVANPTNGSLAITSMNAATQTINLSGAVTSAAAPNPPAAFSATTASVSQINLTATADAAADNIIVAYNTTNTFGTPSGTLVAGGTISGGGTVLYKGSAAALTNHTGLNAGTTYFYSAWSVDGSNNYSSTAITANATTSTPAATAYNVVINQIYGGGGNSGSIYKNDFIELYNNENFAVNLSTWSIQFISAAGGGTVAAPTAWNVGALTGSIPAHGYYLIQESAGTAGTTSLPTPDAIGTFAIGAGSGKAILSNLTTAVTGPNPTGAAIMDKVGFGSTATGYEGSPAPAPADNITSVQRVTDGVDNNNNATDFTVATAIPRNTSYKTSPPAIASLYPANGATGVPFNLTPTIPTIVFSKPIAKGTGSITVYENGVAGTPINVNSSSVVISSGTSVAVSGITFGDPNTAYSIQISAGAFTDVYGNAFLGINDNTTWAFTTAAQTAGVLGSTYTFDNCSAFVTDGFSQYSISGAQVWGCTTFGYDPGDLTGAAAHPNAVQINGYANTINNTNEDWLISPAFDLTATTYPLLSFYSINGFAGDQLQLKVSTNYPGKGNPKNYTWTDVNGKFPGETSSTWTLSNNINLSSYKTAGVYFAFVYTSTTDDGARWTLDNITVTNSATPPPPTITSGAASLQFSYAAAGSSSTNTFTVTGNDLTSDMTLTASSSNFSLSTDGVTYSPSITLLQAAANNVATTVYVRFSPAANNKSYTDSITISTPGATNNIVGLKATSIDPAITLEVVNWNMEWFATPDIGDNLGPADKALQASNARKILKNIGADIFGLVEVVNEDSLRNIVNDMPGYSYVICNYGSHSNPYDASFTEHLDSLQKEAFVYKTNMFSNITTAPMITNGPNTAADLNNPAYNSFSSGRYPFMMKADVTLGSITKTIRFILLHAKANTAPVTTAYARRKAGADTLHYTIQNLYPNDNIIMLGDFNDDLDSTITAGITPKLTSYSSFTTDNTNFSFPTLALSLAGSKSTTSYSDMIDHVILSNEMAPYYMSSSANVLSDVSSLVSKYGTTTSDHYPVFTRYAFDPTILPIKLVSFAAAKENSTVKLTWTTSQEVNSKNFEIQRSTDASTFTTIGTMNAAGNSSSTLSYAFTDNAPASGINYYRLKQVDIDGKFEYSATRSVLFNGRSQVSVSPNPTTDYINIYVSNSTIGSYHVQLADTNGKVLKDIISADQHLQISTSALAKGVYYVKLVDTDAVTTKKIVVQ